MGFEDLPDDVALLPLVDPRLVADVLDLVVRDADRRAGSLAVLLCDDDGRLVQPVVIGDLPDGSDLSSRLGVLEVLISALDGGGSLLVAIARRDGLSITADDQLWARAASQACAEKSARLLGVHVITLTGSRQLPWSDVAA